LVKRAAEISTTEMKSRLLEQKTPREKITALGLMIAKIEIVGNLFVKGVKLAELCELGNHHKLYMKVERFGLADRLPIYPCDPTKPNIIKKN